MSAVSGLTSRILGEGVNRPIPWPELADAWGFVFPEQYVELVERIGIGSFEDFLVMHAPVPPGGAEDGMSGETLTAQETWEFEWSAGMPDVNPRDIVCWATTTSADLLCWVIDRASAETTAIAVWNRGTGEWSMYGMGVQDFLIRMMDRDFVECPLSGEALWGVERITYG